MPISITMNQGYEYFKLMRGGPEGDQVEVKEYDGWGPNAKLRSEGPKQTDTFEELAAIRKAERELEERKLVRKLTEEKEEREKAKKAEEKAKKEKKQGRNRRQATVAKERVVGGVRKVTEGLAGASLTLSSAASTSVRKERVTKRKRQDMESEMKQEERKVEKEIGEVGDVLGSLAVDPEEDEEE